MNIEVIKKTFFGRMDWPMGDKKYLVKEDLFSLKSVANPLFSPDGTKCVFVQTEILRKENRYASNLFLIDVEGEREVKQWTYGEFRNHTPRWSGDGKKIAFVSDRSGRNQIFVMDTAGGEAKQVTNFKNGASNPIWVP